jgi:hypothetical protein
MLTVTRRFFGFDARTVTPSEWTLDTSSVSLLLSVLSSPQKTLIELVWLMLSLSTMVYVNVTASLVRGVFFALETSGAT